MLTIDGSFGEGGGQIIRTSLALSLVEIESEHLTELFSRIGERGVRAEVIAENAADEALAYLDTAAPVGEHLADQLLVPLALCKGGSFTTGVFSLHTQTNINVIKQFLDIEISVSVAKKGIWAIDVRV
jgi:RNA 3'-terminal phosphate cyclase (ATP)